MKAAKLLLVLLLLTSFTVFLNLGSSVTPPKVYIDPVRNDANVDQSFTVFIKITEAIDVRTIELNLRWNASVLSITSYGEGDFLSQGGVRTTFPTFKTYTADPGRLYYVSTIQGGSGGVNGAGTIANATFLVKGAGVSGLFLYDVHMADSFNHPIHSILIEDGYVNLEPPMFAVEPSSIDDATLVADSIFSVNVTLIGAEDVLSYSFKLFYNETGNGIVTPTNVTAAPFLNEPATYNAKINATEKFVEVNATSTAALGVTKNGTVATITFKVNAEGETSLDIAETLLDDRLARVTTPPVAHSPPALDGYFTNVPLGHDVEVSQVSVTPTKLTAGGFVTINATIRNVGGFDESVTVVVYHTGTTEILRQSGVALASGETKNVLLVWDTTNVAPASYVITVKATITNEDRDLTNNSLTYNTPVLIEGGGGVNILLYVGIAAVVVIVVLVIVYFVRFRKKS